MRLLLIQGSSVKEVDAPPEQLAQTDLLWWDCLYDEARLWVGPLQALAGVTIFEDHLLDAENRNHPSYFDSTQSYEMFVFRGLAAAPPEQTETGALGAVTRPTTFFVLPRILITVRPDDSRTIPAMQQRLLTTSQPRLRLPTRSDDLMLRLLNGMVDRYLQLRQPMSEQLERWQRRLLDPRGRFRDWMTLLQSRSELRKLEQLCEEQLDALSEWRNERMEEADGDDGFGPLSDAQQVRANDVAEHINRVLTHARRAQESVETAVQLHFSMTAHRTNEIMRTLTAITAVFLPLTLITGIFGMNFERIPGASLPGGFWITVGAMVMIALLQVIYFRAQRFLDQPGFLRRRSRRPGSNTP
ncbi:MAG: magnesium transporter CorA family protein [Quisquiliibacterium sp.]